MIQAKDTLSTEQKLEILEWLTTKVAIRDIDVWEHDALLHFPTFFVQFLDPSELDDPYQALLFAMRADKQFPTSVEKQEQFNKEWQERGGKIK